MFRNPIRLFHIYSCNASDVLHEYDDTPALRYVAYEYMALPHKAVRRSIDNDSLCLVRIGLDFISKLNIYSAYMDLQEFCVLVRLLDYYKLWFK